MDSVEYIVGAAVALLAAFMAMATSLLALRTLTRRDLETTQQLLTLGRREVETMQELLLTYAKHESETRAAVDRVAHILTSPDQAWYWAPQWQAGEEEASREIAAGELHGTMTEDEFAEYLDRLDAEADAEQAIGQRR